MYMKLHMNELSDEIECNCYNVVQRRENDVVQTVGSGFPTGWRQPGTGSSLALSRAQALHMH